MNKQIITFFAATAAACWMLGVNAFAAEPIGRVDTKTSPLTVRASASTSGKKVASLPKGSTVSLSYRTGDWWYVEYQKGRYGYCHADYITVQDEETAPPVSQSGAIQLQVPDYKQFDDRWAKTKIGSSGETMKKIGCTTTALAGTESFRTGASITPAQMTKKLSYTKGGAVYWPRQYRSSSASDYLSVILQNLQAGKPTIVGAKDSSGKAHWVVVTGYDGSRNPKAANFLVNDPGSNDRTVLSDLFSEYPYFYKLEYYE